MRLGSFGKNLALVLAIACLFSGGLDAALAKKKAKDPAADPAAQAEAKLTQELTPINDQLTKLMMKLQGRYLLSPTEAGQLVELKYKLLDSLSQNPQSAQLTKPLYQAGVLFSQREEYNDAYEMFTYLAQGFPTTQYGLKAKGQMQQLEKRFGPDYFAVEAAVAAPPTETTGAETASNAPSTTTPEAGKAAAKK